MSTLTDIVTGIKNWVSGGFCDKSGTEARIATLTDELNALKALPHIVEKGGDQSNWYRLWSDGWLEQGGHISNSGSRVVTVTFLKSFSDANYNSQATITHAETGWTATVNVGIKTGSKTTSNMIVMNWYNSSYTTGVHDWYCCGY